MTSLMEVAPPNMVPQRNQKFSVIDDLDVSADVFKLSAWVTCSKYSPNAVQNNLYWLKLPARVIWSK